MSGEHKDGKTTWNKPEKFKWAEGGKKEPIEKASAAMNAMGFSHKQPGTKPVPGKEPTSFEPTKKRVRKDEGMSVKYPPDKKSTPEDLAARDRAKSGSEEVDKGFLTHMKHQGLVPKDKAGYGKHGSDMAHHRQSMKESRKVTEDVKQKDVGEGMRNLHKAMCPVIKGLQKLLKGLGGDIDKSTLGRKQITRPKTRGTKPGNSKAIFDEHGGSHQLSHRQRYKGGDTPHGEAYD